MDPYPRVKKCALCIDLKMGVFLYIIFEMMVWLFLSWLSIDNESEFFHSYDLYKFEDHIDENWYYTIMFGTPTSDGEDYDYDYGYESNVDDSDGIDEDYRFQCITINGILMTIFVAYFILSMMFMIGIAKQNTHFFIPYIVFDMYIIFMSAVMVIAGLFYVNVVLIRNCSIFASVKFYPAICNYSLFRKLGGKFKFSRNILNQEEKKDARDFEMEQLNDNKQHVITMIDRN